MDASIRDSHISVTGPDYTLSSEARRDKGPGYGCVRLLFIGISDGVVVLCSGYLRARRARVQRGSKIGRDPLALVGRQGCATRPRASESIQALGLAFSPLCKSPPQSAHAAPKKSSICADEISCASPIAIVGGWLRSNTVAPDIELVRSRETIDKSLKRSRDCARLDCSQRFFICDPAFDGKLLEKLSIRYRLR